MPSRRQLGQLGDVPFYSSRFILPRDERVSVMSLFPRLFLRSGVGGIHAAHDVRRDVGRRLYEVALLLDHQLLELLRGHFVDSAARFRQREN